MRLRLLLAFIMLTLLLSNAFTQNTETESPKVRKFKRKGGARKRYTIWGTIAAGVVGLFSSYFITAKDRKKELKAVTD